jgi:hypothetical protein
MASAGIVMRWALCAWRSLAPEAAVSGGKKGGQPPLGAAASTSPRERPYFRVSDCLKDLLPEPEEPWEIVRVRDVARHHAVAWQSRSQVTTDPLDS